jgi:hypothetical protein
LADLGISKNESAQAQEFASIAEEAFERFLGESASGELSDAALLRRIRASKRTPVKAKASTPTDGGESAPTVPSQAAELVSLAVHLARAADELGEWKRTSFLPLREAARGREKIEAELGRVERYTDESVEWLRGLARAIGS